MKSTSTALTNRIAAYKAQVDPLSIDPVLDGGIKQDLLDTLNNKARSKALLTLSVAPASDIPTSEVGLNGEYYIYLGITPIVYLKSAGIWSAVESTNDMMFFNNGSDGVRRYYSFAEDLLSVVKIHEIDFGDISGSALKYIPQSLTSVQKTQARDNIDAAAKTYVDNLFAQLIKSGAVGTECAGSVKPWFGIESTIPAGWAKIAETQTWFLKSDYPDLYAALGGESNPWGLTSTSFSIPWAMAGTSFIKEGSIFPAFSKGGETTHLLTALESGVQNHRHRPVIDEWGVQKHGLKYGSDADGIIAGEDQDIYVGSVEDGGKSAITAHNNMPPYVAMFWVIKLANSTNSAIIDSELSYKNVSITEMSESGVITIPVGLFIKDVNVAVISGNPTIEISELSTGQMSGQDIYPISANYRSTGNLTINISGAGTIKVQIVKFNI